MTISQAFDTLLTNIKVDNYEQISNRYKEITKKLNKTFRSTDSETDNSLQVGSYGRYTGIKGISDLDMLYIMPNSSWEKYKDSPAKLLRDTKTALCERYPNTDITYDRLVVVVQFVGFKFEVQPVFEADIKDDLLTYKYPDTACDSYRITMPKHEQKAMVDFRREYGDKHRKLCKLIRAWKNHVGLNIGGLLIDTLTYNFLSKNIEYIKENFDVIVCEFFQYLNNEPDQKHYCALGSGQHVKVKKNFKSKARKALAIARKALEANEDKKHEIWQDVFGKLFPCRETRSYSTYDNTEEYIEDRYPVDIRYNVRIDCIVEANGFRTQKLTEILIHNPRIPRMKSLRFILEKCDVPEPYEVKWKVRNVGTEAERRNCIRGQIVGSNMAIRQRKESSDFYGAHYVECYIIKNEIVVGRDRIDVPIE